MTQHTNTRINPSKFTLWVGMAAIIMMFVALTSAYIVKHAAGNWLEFPIPNIFYVSTAIIVLGSITLHTSFISYKKGNEKMYKGLLVVAFIASIAFVVCQYYGWQELFGMGVDLKGNVSGSFFYLITGVHAAHVLAGVAAILVALISAFTLKFKYSEKRKNRFELVLHYWHFVDILWIYLLFFLLQH